MPLRHPPSNSGVGSFGVIALRMAIRFSDLLVLVLRCLLGNSGIDNCMLIMHMFDGR